MMTKLHRVSKKQGIWCFVINLTNVNRFSILLQSRSPKTFCP